jgi:hypothetical protein
VARLSGMPGSSGGPGGAAGSPPNLGEGRTLILPHPVLVWIPYIAVEWVKARMTAQNDSANDSPAPV